MKINRWRIVALLMMVALAGVLYYENRPERLHMHRVTNAVEVVEKVRSLRELVTVRYSVQKVAGIQGNDTLLIVQAQVLGGVDFGKVQASDVRMDAKGRVQITLPAASIQRINLDERNTKVWDRTKSWWTPWVPNNAELEKKAREAALESVKQEALDMGILLEAQIQAQNFIRALLRGAGVDEVIFRA